MPDYASLLKSVGIEFSYKYEQKPSFGASIQNLDNKWLISSNPQSDSSSYNAGLSKGDEIVSIDGKLTNNKLIPNDFFMSYKPGDTVKVVYNRFGQGKETIMVFKKNRSYKTVLEENPEKNNRKRRENWLKKRGR